MKIADFSSCLPLLRPEEYLSGKLEGWALLEGPLGGIQRRAAIRASGHWDETSRSLSFTETWTFDNGETDRVDWAINKMADGSYSGIEKTVVGEAKGEAAGCAFHWTYTRDVPGKDGSTRLNFDDWFMRIDDDVVIVKGTAGRLGLPFASAHVTYRRLR